jgi:hypothetical protein
MEEVFEPVPVPRADAEWRRLLAGLVDSLSNYTGVRFAQTACRVSDTPTGPTPMGAWISVASSIPLCSWSCAGWCSSMPSIGRPPRWGAVLLLFAAGRRMLASGGLEFVVLHYRPGGWASEGWVDDEYDAWAEHHTDAAWTDKHDARAEHHTDRW